MLKNKLNSFFIALLISLIAVIPAFAGISGPGASGIQIQNLNLVDQATVLVQLWNQNGSAPLTISDTSGDLINPGTSKTYYLPYMPGHPVPDGSYAMVVSADNPIAAIARTDWSSTGGAAFYGSVDPGTDILIPLILKDFANQTSQFSIQNTNTGSSINDVAITLYACGSSTPVTTLTSQTILAGTSKTYNMSDGIWGTLPDSGWSCGLGAHGFLGSVRITSATPLVVQSFIDLASSRGVTGFNGVPSNLAESTLYCPLIRANYYGDTGINIVNPGGSAVSVQIVFRADAGSPNSGVYTQTLSVPANSMNVAFQGPTGNSRSAPTNLPGGSQSSSNPTPTNDGFYGVATLTATGGDILAVVNDTKFGSGWSVQSQSTYNCATPTNAGNKFALPLVRRLHLSDTKLTTGIQIQNISGSSVTVSLDLYNWDGSSQAASNPAPLIINPYGSGNYWNGNLTGLPTVPPSQGGYGWYGSAILTATGGNVVVEVSDEGFGSTAVDSANYMGLKIPTP